MRSDRKSALSLIVIAALLWSTGGLFIKWTSLNAYALSFGRAFFAAITVGLLTRKQGFRLNRVSALAAVCYAALLFLFVLATKLTTAANAIFLQYTAPIYVLVLEPWLFKERFRAGDLLAVFACIAGMALFFTGKLRPEDVAGNLVALASGVFFAAYVLLLRHPRTREGNRASSVVWGNALLALAMLPFGIKALPTLTLHDALTTAYLGIVQLGFAYVAFVAAMSRGVRSLEASLVSMIEPVLNPVWVFLVLGEEPSRGALAGGAIILGAVATHALIGARSQNLATANPG
jgi:DME family drug/metabolite transporter